MEAFAAHGEFTVAPEVHRHACDLIRAHRLSDGETRARIKDAYRRNGILLDPHSAIGVAAARAHAGDGDAPTVALATAHPAKFGDAVAAACGDSTVAELPPRLRDLMQREERVTAVAADAAAVMAVIESGGA